MDKTLAAKHHSNKQVLLTLEENERKFSAIPAMQNAFSELASKVNITSELIARAGSIPNKPASNKSLTRENLATLCFKIGNILKVFAYSTLDENLASSLILSESELTTRMRHEDLLTYAKNLDEKVNPVKEELANYGLTGEMLTGLADKIKQFETDIHEPRKLIRERKTTNELLEDNVDEINILLNNKIDLFMELFMDDREFYLAYKSARMIVDPASRKRVTENEVEQ